jgi:hypothetical protein
MADYSKQAAPPSPGDVKPPQASPGSDSKSGGKSCDQGAGTGSTGTTGTTGNLGQSGGTGGPASQIKIAVQEMSGDYTYATNGGKGGGGPLGGIGGPGQTIVTRALRAPVARAVPAAMAATPAPAAMPEQSTSATPPGRLTSRQQ